MHLMTQMMGVQGRERGAPQESAGPGTGCTKCGVQLHPMHQCSTATYLVPQQLCLRLQCCYIAVVDVTQSV